MQIHEVKIRKQVIMARKRTQNQPLFQTFHYNVICVHNKCRNLISTQSSIHQHYNCVEFVVLNGWKRPVDKNVSTQPFLTDLFSGFLLTTGIYF